MFELRGKGKPRQSLLAELDGALVEPNLTEDAYSVLFLCCLSTNLSYKLHEIIGFTGFYLSYLLQVWSKINRISVLPQDWLIEQFGRFFSYSSEQISETIECILF